MNKPLIEKPLPAELAAFLATHPETRFVDALLFDLCGTAIGKRLPVRDAAKLWSSGAAFCAGITTLDALGTCWDVNGIGFSDGDPDATSYPLPGTLVTVPWQAGVAQVQIAPAAPEGSDGWWFDPRRILERVVARFAELKLTPVVACELEFYLVDPARDENGRIHPARPARAGRAPEAPRVLAFDKLDEFGTILAEIDAACQAQGLPAGAATAEYGGAQFEVNLDHLADPVRACDHALMLRRIVKGVAQKHGLDATFLSKPFTEQSGSGLHIHMSLADTEGRNIFDERSPQGDRMLGHAIAGLQATSADAMAIFAPNLNAYRRFGPNLFVPVNTSWGFNNRSVAFRVPTGGGQARRIEHRFAGADANPYLVMAAMLAGVHHGLVNRLEATAASTGNAGEEVDPAMPMRLWTALDKIEGSAILADYFGPRYPAAYAAIKRSELDAFLADVLPREYDWYL
ncbi:glutamine synthetase family protein [Tabrizicola sp. J26]|uniref:glutamine synthetase family protein n=1 Tax=Alitabrizicola rongguiensis TaxID=2909234 RepID=UPI001F420E75|nr:glutamine synthetase family protein [Tabrizicola rongguiensis]MCF1709079.1 glutamine synthetase family protein [Tabrizicola rongguiensis]